MENLSEIIILAKKFIGIPTVPENRKKINMLLEYVQGYLNEYDVMVFEKEGIQSLLFYNKRPQNNHFTLILNAHLDVVPAKTEQYKPYERDGKLYGRGSADMKTAAAALIVLFKHIAHRLSYPIALQIVTDEETGGDNGTKYQIDQGVRAEFIIAGEFTNLSVNTQAKGILCLKIQTIGKSAHSAYLWNGGNAIAKMANIITKIQETFPIPQADAWETTVNIGKITTTNIAVNKVPDHCEIDVDIRYIPEDKEKTIAKIKEIVKKEKNSKLEIVEDEPAQIVNENNRYFQLLIQTIEKQRLKKVNLIKKHGASDVRHYCKVGNDGVVFGLTGEGIHSDNEFVNIPSIPEYYQILENFLLQV